MTTQCPMHDFLSERFIEDAFFERAYDEVGDYGRSLLKTAIAGLYSWYPPAAATSGIETRYRRQGIVSTVRTVPAEYALLFLDAENRSPSRMLAGLLPALTSGVEYVVPVWTCPQDEISPSMLTALELAGVEHAACLGDEDVIPAARSGSGVVLDFRESSGWERELSEEVLPEWAPPMVDTAGVYMGSEDAFNLEALAFAHPDLRFEVWGTNRKRPEGDFVPVSGTAEDFVTAGYDVAYCSGPIAGAVPSTLVFGPGYESCWAWPDLHADFFMRNTIYWGSEAPWTEMT